MSKKLKCPECGSENITVQIVESGAKTKRKGNGVAGHLNNTARGLTAVATLGVSNIFWKKSKGSNTTKIKNEKVAICQDCGHSWKIK